MGNRSISSHGPLSHLTKLAMIEVQICMHFLEGKERVQVARCSRRLLRDMSDPFAWKFCPPMVVDIRSLGRSPTCFDAPCSLLRPLKATHVLCHVRLTDILSRNDAKRIPLIQSMEFNVAKDCTGIDWRIVFAHTSLIHVHAVTIHRQRNVATLDSALLFLPTLPNLHSLNLPYASYCSQLLGLKIFHSLTELACSFEDWRLVLNGLQGERRCRCFVFICVRVTFRIGY
jgi:hypothetical protein